MKLCGYGIGKNFDKVPLAVEKKNYLSKIVNVYIVFDLDVWPKNLLIISTLRIAYLEQFTWSKTLIKKNISF